MAQLLSLFREFESFLERYNTSRIVEKRVFRKSDFGSDSAEIEINDADAC
jgi:hypothetical protein